MCEAQVSAAPASGADDAASSTGRLVRVLYGGALFFFAKVVSMVSVGFSNCFTVCVSRGCSCVPKRALIVCGLTRHNQNTRFPSSGPRYKVSGCTREYRIYWSPANAADFLGTTKLVQELDPGPDRQSVRSFWLHAARLGVAGWTRVREDADFEAAGCPGGPIL